jgi:hypothetical protein
VIAGRSTILRSLENRLCLIDPNGEDVYSFFGRAVLERLSDGHFDRLPPNYKLDLLSDAWRPSFLMGRYVVIARLSGAPQHDFPSSDRHRKSYRELAQESRVLRPAKVSRSIDYRDVGSAGWVQRPTNNKIPRQQEQKIV